MSDKDVLKNLTDVKRGDAFNASDVRAIARMLLDHERRLSRGVPARSTIRGVCSVCDHPWSDDHMCPPSVIWMTIAERALVLAFLFIAALTVALLVVRS